MKNPDSYRHHNFIPPPQILTCCGFVLRLFHHSLYWKSRQTQMEKSEQDQTTIAQSSPKFTGHQPTRESHRWPNRASSTCYCFEPLNVTLKLNVDSVGLVNVFFVVTGSSRSKVGDLLAEIDEQSEPLFGQRRTKKILSFAFLVLKRSSRFPGAKSSICKRYLLLLKDINCIVNYGVSHIIIFK